MVSLRVLFFLLISVSCYSQKRIQLQLNGLAGTNFWRTTGNSSTNPSTNFLGTTDAQDLVIKTNDTEAMRVDANGNVGIGTAVPSAGLHIQGKSIEWFTSDTMQRALFMYSHDTTTSISSILADESGSQLVTRSESGAEAIFRLFRPTGHIHSQYLSDSTYFGIGTETPTAKLHVNGTTRLEGTPQSLTSDSLLTIDNDGNVSWRTPYYYGTGTLINGVDTIFTSDVTANSIILVTSNGLNATTQTGHLDVPTISDGNYFVVNSLKLNTTIEADDQRSYYWFFIRKP